MQLINLSQKPITGFPVEQQPNGQTASDSRNHTHFARDGLTPDTYAENKELLLRGNSGKLLYSMQEASALLGVSYEFVRQNVRSGKVAVKNFGARKLIHINEITRLITEGITL